MMDYFHVKKAKSKSLMSQPVQEVNAPVLSEADEAFLARIESEGTPPELPARPAPQVPQRPQDLPEVGEASGNNAQIALLDGSQNIPLPDVPDTPNDTPVPKEIVHSEEGETKGKHKEKKSKWSFLRKDSRDSKQKNKEATATGLMSAAENLKAADAHPNEDGIVSNPELKKEEEEMASVLEDLNLAAVNNRVFSVSKESQELMRKCVMSISPLKTCSNRPNIH